MWLLLCGVMVLSTSSCKKENDPEDCLLSTFKLTEENEQTINYCIYNEHNDLVEYNQDGAKTKIFYDGSRQINKFEFYSGTAMMAFVEVIRQDNLANLEYFFEDEGEFYGMIKQVIRYNAAGKVDRLDLMLRFMDEWIPFYYYDLVWADNNISSLVYYGHPETKSLEAGPRIISRRPIDKNLKDIIFSKSTNQDMVKIATVTYSYDDKKNPFWTNEAFFILEGDPLFLSRNNVKTELIHYHIDDQEATIEYNYEYQYNYPIKMQASGWSMAWELSYNCE